MFGIDYQHLFVMQGFVAGGVALALALYLLPRQQNPGTRALIGLVVPVAAWSFTYAMELRAPDLAAKLDWVVAEYLGAVWTGPLFFRFAMILAGKTNWISGLRNWMIMGVPVVTLLLVFTNDHHHLMWQNAWIDTSAPIATLAFKRGMGFWGYIGFAYSLLLVASLVLFQTFQSSGKLERHSFWILMIGLSAPWACNFLYIFKIGYFRYIDFTPSAFTISGIAFFYGVIRRRLLELVPIARDVVIESLADAVFVLNLQGQVVDLNSSAKKMVPVPPAGYVGHLLEDLFPWLWDTIGKLDPSPDRPHEVRFAVGGRHRLLQITQATLYGNGDAPRGRLVTLHDITERRQNEMALRESEAKFRSISANALDGIIMMDPDGRISFWNLAAEKIFGYAQNEILGKTLHETLAPPHYHEPYLKAFGKFQETGMGDLMGRTIETECLHKDGHVFPAEIALSPMKLNEKWHAVGIVRDITERKRTQEYLIQSEKMLSVGGLAAGMAHEINNPLSGILSNIQMVYLRLTEDLPANRAAAQRCGLDLDQLKRYIDLRGIREMIAATETSCQRAAGIVRNMLDFSRKSDTRFTRHDLARLMDQTVALADNDFKLKRQFDFRKIVIIRDFATDVPGVPCDGGQIQQVLLNILKNGAQAMWEIPADQRDPKFVLRTYYEPPHACMAVSDNGPGVSESVRQRMFEPFFTTKPMGVGTGLGLAVAYFIIVERHGGTIEAVPAPSGGTTFVIKLPIDRENQ